MWQGWLVFVPSRHWVDARGIQPPPKYCDDNDIRLDTSVAKEEHISNGNKLGIIDRLVRTLRELIERYFDITGHRTDNIKDVMKSIIETYNSSSHRTLNKKISNQVFEDNDDQMTRHLNDSVHNNKNINQYHFKRVKR